MSISSDEVNFLIYRYLQENGFMHSAFTFAYESLVIKSSTAQTEIPPGALITFLQKGLEYIAIEEHINEDGTIQEFENNFSLLSPVICESLAAKDDRRVRRSVPPPQPVVSNDNTGTDSSAPMEDSSNAIQGSEETKSSNAMIPSTSTLIEDKGSKYLQLNGHQGEVFMCLWNPVQRQLASGCADGMCRLWSLWEMTAQKWTAKDSNVSISSSIMPHITNEGEKYKDVTSVTWSPDGSMLATGCYDGMARIWDNRGKLIRQLKEHSGPVFSLKWSKSGKYILSGSYDRRAIVWSVQSGTIVRSFLLHAGPVLDVDWKDGDLFATCSSDRTIFVCKASATKDDSYLHRLAAHDDEVNAVCWSPGGHYLASCSDDGTAKIWTLENGLKFDLKSHEKEIFTLKWTPTGSGSETSSNKSKPLYLCTASFDGTVKVWNGETGELAFNLCKQVQPVYSLAPCPSGDLIATGSLGGNVAIWSLATGELIQELQGIGDAFDVSWSTDAALLCACFSSGKVNVLDTEAIVSNAVPSTMELALAAASKTSAEIINNTTTDDSKVKNELSNNEDNITNIEESDSNIANIETNQSNQDKNNDVVNDTGGEMDVPDDK